MILSDVTDQTTYSIAEAEILSGVSRATIYRRIAAGELRTIKAGSRQEILADELLRFMGSLERPDA